MSEVHVCVLTPLAIAYRYSCNILRVCVCVCIFIFFDQASGNQLCMASMRKNMFAINHSHCIFRIIQRLNYYNIINIIIHTLWILELYLFLAIS